MNKISKSAPLTATEKAAQLSEALTRMHDSTSFIEQSNLRLLLGIDEASGLLQSAGSSSYSSFFSIFRSALRMIPSQSSKFFAVLADTNSRVSNFHHHPLHDPIQENGEEMPKDLRLFKPI
ncbi:hypothetical protein PtA15_16A46 [Puccinia triticina]|uniref:Uncharacterized protein n=1 Tax=Puccinia triticina TaxID=208348 RepID=A0ABY7D4H4_9BASI|nr:uncharacterized protein PtA15_16A46 [Puccinia triticina]WAQ92140.1 hypothetical protein PtA15_16A46 [Puccinia triticina]